MAKTPENHTEKGSIESFVDQLILRGIFEKIQSLAKNFDELIVGELIDMFEFPAELIIKLFEDELTVFEEDLIAKATHAVRAAFENNVNLTMSLEQVIFNKPNMFTLIVDDSQHYFSFKEKDFQQANKRQSLVRVAVSQQLSAVGSSNQASIQVLSSADLQEITKRTRGIMQKISSDDVQVEMNQLLVSLRLGKLVYSANKS